MFLKFKISFKFKNTCITYSYIVIRYIIYVVIVYI